MRKTGKKKNFVLDTNILLHDKNAIFGFDDNNVYITGTTLQELDATLFFENAECQRSTLASAAIELLKEGK